MLLRRTLRNIWAANFSCQHITKRINFPVLRVVQETFYQKLVSLIEFPGQLQQLQFKYSSQARLCSSEAS